MDRLLDLLHRGRRVPRVVVADYPRVAPGVRGEVVERQVPVVGRDLKGLDRYTFVNIVVAEREGNGDVGRWLDSLPRDHVVIVTSVISERLKGMLERRGFTFNRYGDQYERWPLNCVSCAHPIGDES